MNIRSTPTTNIALAAIAFLSCSANAAVIGQLGVLDDAANGGLNPTTGFAWAAGDQYRLAFYTEDKRDALSNDISVYNTFVQNVAAGSTAFANLGSGTWNVLGSTSTISARQNTGTDTNDGIPIFVLDGTTMIAVNSDDMWDGFGQRFDAASSPSGQAMFFSPYLDENGVENFVAPFGAEIATGSNADGTISNDPLGDPDNDGLRLAVGAQNANSASRVFLRFGNRNPSADYSFYALSEPLTVIPEPSAAMLFGLAGLSLLRRRRK